MKYVYPAIFTAYDGGFEVKFPDLENCYTDGKNMIEAFLNAEDVLNLTLWNMEEKKLFIPPPSNPKIVTCDDSSFISLVSADTLEYRKQNDSKAVKKTLTIPQWLDTMAQEKNINFSNVLQNALMCELNVDGKPDGVLKAITETQFLNAIPNMAKSILEGAKLPVEDCISLKGMKY